MKDNNGLIRENLVVGMMIKKLIKVYYRDDMKVNDRNDKNES